MLAEHPVFSNNKDKRVCSAEYNFQRSRLSIEIDGGHNEIVKATPPLAGPKTPPNFLPFRRKTNFRHSAIKF